MAPKPWLLQNAQMCRVCKASQETR